MKHTRRSRTSRLAWLAIPAAAGLALAGCSGSGSTGKEPQTITFAYGATNDQDKAAYDGLAKAFEAENKGVTITTQNLPVQSYGTTIATRVQGGNAPDTFFAEGGTGQAQSILPWAKSGLVLPLDDASITKNMPDSAKSLYTYNGKIYGILAVALATSTVYGKDKDWNAKRAQNKVTFAGTKGWTTALESVKKMFDAGCFQDGATSAGFDALTNGASSGKILGFFAPSGAAQQIMQAAGGHVKLIALPVGAPDGTKTYLSLSADQGVTASAKTKSPKLATDFLSYIISDKGQEAYSKEVGSIPVNVKNDSTLLPQYAAIKDEIAKDDTRGYAPTEWPNAKIYTDLGNGVQGILTGQMTVKQVLQQMDTDWG